MIKLRILADSYFPISPTSFLVNDTIIIDAGNIIRPLGIDNIKKIKYFIITHSHMDHIMDLPLALDLIVWNSSHTVKIYSNEKTIEALRKYIFNDTIWPNLEEKLSHKNFLEFVCIKDNSTFTIDNIKFTPLKSEHIIETTSFVVNDKVIITGDTYKNDRLVDYINKNKSIHTLIIDVSWPERLKDVAYITKHHCTSTFIEEMEKLRDNIKILAYHVKPDFFDEVESELKKHNIEIIRPHQEIVI